MIGRARFTSLWLSSFWLEAGRQTFGVHIRSQLFAMSEASNADTTADGDNNPSDTALDRTTSRPEGMGRTHHMCTGRSSLRTRAITV
jgi:hypothetical protein